MKYCVGLNRSIKIECINHRLKPLPNLENLTLHIMVEPNPHHPQLLGNLNNWYNISNGLFCLMSESSSIRAELGRSWATISQEINVEEAQELGRQN